MSGELGIVLGYVLVLGVPIATALTLARVFLGRPVTQEKWEEAMKNLEDASPSQEADNEYEKLKAYGKKRGWD